MTAPLSPIRFGTDGVRGRAGEWPLDTEGAVTIGLAAGTYFRDGPLASVLVGRDTRESGAWLSHEIGNAMAAAGVHVLHTGVLPTAALSCAVAATDAAGGVMITASHNPWPDNGVKVLDAEGRKLEDHGAIEALFGKVAPAGGGRVRALADPTRAWEEAMPEVDLSGLTILLDCAHGAAALAAPPLLRQRGARLVLVGCEPDGRNINEGVGALHPPAASRVREAGCELAICLDGDADRVVLVHPEHGILDGDDLLFLLARDREGPVVGTIMSNGGLEVALGGRLLRTPVGDSHVARKMCETGAQVGGETSGHVLFSDGLPTGDGLYTALRVLQATEGDLSGVRDWQRWPVASRNLRFQGERRPLDDLAAVRGAEAAGNRVVVRYSGTEPLLRILVEGLANPSGWVERIAREFAG